MRHLLPILLAVSIPLAASLTLRADDKRDAAIVETLLRLKHIDVNQRGDLKAAAIRYLQQHSGTARYVDLVRKLKLRGVEDRLLEMALADPTGNTGVQAATLLLERGEVERFRQILADDVPESDPPNNVAAPKTDPAVSVAQVLGMIGNKEANGLLRPLVTDDRLSRAVRNAAAAGVGRGRGGQRFLLNLVREGKLPPELKFTVANALVGSPDSEIRTEAAKYLELPAAAGSKPLPPVSRLVKMKGDPQRGQQLFKTTGTCIKCHKVRGEGKDVGPNLSEVGSKLSPEAVFVSVLDPRAGISHNYEMYSAVTDGGQVVSGLLISRTDQHITLRTAEAIDKTFGTDELEEFIQSEVSLMPADLQKLLSVQDLVDIVAFLRTLRKERVEK